MRGIGIFHPTYYELSEGFHWEDIKCPIVVTVYDLIHAIYPHLMDRSEANIRTQRAAVQRADRVICISHATERDLLDHFPEVAGKTCVIHLGSSFAINEAPIESRIFEPPSFLYVGGRGGYKNFRFLMHAFSKACSMHSTMRLRIAGYPLTAEERWLIHDLGVTDRVDAYCLPHEEEMERLYRGSVALVYPSRHEGFGIPPIEAMACGTVAVTSDTTSLPEVVGDAGIMLDPTDQESWTDCLLMLASDATPRAGLLERGRQRAAMFSWRKTVDQHLSVYRALQ
jgi:glycosyltransferase involved in cell wall biosynthesis